MFNLLSSLLLLLVSATLAFAAETDDPAKKPAEDVVFRDPFTLILPVSKEEFYKEKFDKVPYVEAGDVYLFKDDEFGITLDVQDNVIRAIKYQKDLKKADVTFKYTQFYQVDGKAATKVAIRNQTDYSLKGDAMMTIAGKEGTFETALQPIGPGYASYEQWPHPIVQVVIRNIRIEK